VASVPTSTFNGAAARRAVHARYERPPVLDDTWALRLIDRKTRWIIRIPPLYRRVLAPQQARSNGYFATAVCNLRMADDLAEDAVRAGIHQYVVLGAGLDSFGVRRQDLADSLRVYELDHPAPQAIKRRRIVRAAGSIPANLELVPIDFEITSIPAALRESSFDTTRPALASWLNTIPYLTEDAVRASLAGLAEALAPGSTLLMNYPPRVALSAEAREAMEQVRASVERRGEPFRSAYLPDDMLALVTGAGFDIDQHLTEADLAARFLSGRTGGPYATIPARTIVARRP
jgi:methyltransferase (TIGR00027 family)